MPQIPPPPYKSVLTATDWYAWWSRPNPGAATGTTDNGLYLQPLVGWAHIATPVARIGVPAGDRLVGIVLARDAKSTILVNETADDFVRYVNRYDIDFPSERATVIS